MHASIFIALDHFIYDPVDAKFIGERQHLHPILAEEADRFLAKNII